MQQREGVCCRQMIIFILKTHLLWKLVMGQELKSFGNKEYYIEYRAAAADYTKAKELCKTTERRLVAVTETTLFDFLAKEIQQNQNPGILQCQC